MTSQIDPTVPVTGTPTTASVRANFATAQVEITNLQNLVASNAALAAPLNSPALTGDPTAPTPATTDNDTSIATTAFVQAAARAVMQSSGIPGNVGRNWLHNSLYNIQQRGPGPWSTASNTLYTFDRWAIQSVGGDAATVAVTAAVDADRAAIGDEACFQLAQVNFTGTAGAAAVTRFMQSVEDVRRLAGKQITVSGWMRSPGTPVKVGIGIEQYYGSGGAGDFNMPGQSVQLTTSWARYVVSFTLPSSAGRAAAGGNSLTNINFYLSAGANFNASAGSIGVQSGQAQFWGVQVEIGSVATPLEKIDPADDLRHCQRFYQTASFQIAGYGLAGSIMAMKYQLPVVMRAAPTIALSGQGVVNQTSYSVTAPAASDLMVQVTPSTTAWTNYYGAYTASADL